MNKYVFMNNKFMPENEAHIDIHDLGFLRGYGVFDVAVATGQNVFRLKEHLDRFEKSAKSIYLKLPYSKIKIEKIALELLKKNNFANSSVRFVLTGGISPDGRTVGKETFAIIVDESKPFPEDYYTKGVKVITREFKREKPRTKHLNYQNAFSIYQTFDQINAFEIIYTCSNFVLEGATSNIFIIKNNKIATPVDEILLGITRAEVIKIASNNQLEVSERAITVDELLRADEVFITATFKKIMPVVSVDGKKIGDGKPGKLTQRLMNEFYRL